MRSIRIDEVTSALGRLRERAERWLPPDVGMMVECALETERDERLRQRLEKLYECFIGAGVFGGGLGLETSGLLVFAAVGGDIQLDGFSIEDAVRRVSGGLDWEFVPEPAAEEGLRLTVMPVVSDFREGCFPCPAPLVPAREAISICTLGRPFVVGLGYGSDPESARRASLLALRRPVDSANPDIRLADVERSIKDRINSRAGKGENLALAVLAEAVGPREREFCVVRIVDCMLRRAGMYI